MNRNSLFCFFIIIGVILFTPMNSYSKSNNKFVVVLDAGHGGGDIGTPHRKMKKDEKTIALDVTLRLGKLIQNNYKDVKVVYTRTKDVYPSLPDRTKTAKDAQGDLFISVHVNAAPSSSARGFETYVFGVTGLSGKSADEQKRIRDRMANERENLDISGKLVDFDRDMDIETKILCQAQREKNNIYSEEVAKYVHNSLISSLKKTSYKNNVNDRGVKEKNIFVLCYSPMPSILVELGYMSNVAEEKFINSEEALSTFAQAIFQGFKKYKNSWDKRKLDNKDKTPVEIEPEINEEPAKENKEPKEPKQPEVTTPSNNNNPTSQEITYKIQFLSSSKILKKGDKELKGLWPVEYYKDGNVYRYTYGQGKTSTSLSQELKKVKNNFPDAFIIKMDAQNNRIR